jgi:ADP-ribose pyrophosphatase YjhB (NUDIX family)
MRFRVGVFATVYDEQGCVLLCHRRDADFWNQPGGGMEPGEAPWEGVVREVREEVGLEVAVERLAGVYSLPATGEIIFSSVCRATGGAPTTSAEADEVGYFPLDALPPNTFAEHVKRIRDVCAGHDRVILRVPNGPSAADELQQSRR